MLAALIERMLELLFDGADPAAGELHNFLYSASAPGDSSGRSGRGQLSFDWTRRTVETVSDSESTRFSAQGIVCTVDGQSLTFGLDLDLNRTSVYSSEEIRSGTVVLRDPLVVNFDGKACELNGRRFSFDLDGDGRLESLPGLASSSGFLALDRNADGRITDGNELFGARSGDGFADLAADDGDGNGWIDESDPVFDHLCVWGQDAQGNDRTTSLRAAGIGAIYLGSASTAFSLKDDAHAVLAQIRASGVYLREGGGAGSIQQIDLSVLPPEEKSGNAETT